MTNTEQYTRRGEFHRRNSDECQDVVCYRENEDFSMIALADGATFCENGRIGAAISCEAALDFYMNEAEYLERFPKNKAAALILEQIQFRLLEAAGKNQNSFESYASTLAFAFFDKRRGELTAFNLGDGGIFLTDKKKCHSLLLPSAGRQEKGIFTTGKSIYSKAKIERKNVENMDSVWICSDGILNEMRRWSVEDGFKKDMIKGNYRGARRRLNSLQAEDDCSFIAMKIGLGR